MKVHYPPVGIAHITSQLSDLFVDRLKGVKEVRIACISQPKTDPHFGTMLVLFCCFAFAKEIREKFNIPTTVLIDSLENSPANEIIVNGVTYSLCLSHQINKGKSAAEVNLKPIIELSEWASKKSKIEFRLRSYKEIQSQKKFREGLIKILQNKSIFIPIVSPSERDFRIRPVCLKCGLLDKAAKTVQFDNATNPTSVSFVCPNHGTIKSFLDDPSCVIDCNTPIRTILRSYCFFKERQSSGVETIIINGSDWAGAWMQRVYFDGLANLDCKGIDTPFNLFTPLILDETGAKLSKTIYLEKGAYSEIDKSWLSVPAFILRFGDRGLNVLWDEIESWINSPERFFRDYSLSYIKHLFESC